MREYQIDLRKRIIEHKRSISVAAIGFLSGLSLIFFSSIPFFSSADVAHAFPTNCSGDWIHPERVSGEPESLKILASYFDKTESAAYPPGSDTRIFCTFSSDGTPTSRPLERATLTFFFVKSTEAPEVIETRSKDNQENAAAAVSVDTDATNTETDVAAEIDSLLTVATSTESEESDSQDSSDTPASASSTERMVEPTENGAHTDVGRGLTPWYDLGLESPMRSSLGIPSHL